MGQGVLGVTEAGGRITIINGWNWYLGTDTSTVGKNQYDFETVIAHELGHALGLGHSVDGGSVMYPYLATGQGRRTLTFSDVALIDEDRNAQPEALMISRQVVGQQPTPVVKLAVQPTHRAKQQLGQLVRHATLQAIKQSLDPSVPQSELAEFAGLRVPRGVGSRFSSTPVWNDRNDIEKNVLIA
jgi:hypothetical protein